MRRLKLFLDAKAANTPPRGISKASRVIFSVLTLLFLSIGQVWATDYQLVTSTSDLEAGANYVIGSAASGSGVFMATTSNNNNRRGTESITITNSKISATDAVLVLELGGSTGAWTFKTTNYAGTDGYLAAASNNSNYCQVITDGTQTRAKFTISFSDDAVVITATGGGNRRNMRYNPNNGNPLFACYQNATDQSPIYLYKEVTSGGSACATPTFDPASGEIFSDDIDVEIACATDGVTIYYTTDGEDPTTSSDVYTTALNFTETTTLKAMAVKEGSNNSAVATATYTKMATVPGYEIDFESELAAYTDWTFVNFTKTNETITVHGGSYFAKTNGTNTASITTKTKVANPGILTYYISKIGTNTNANSKWKARVSSDGTNWTIVGTEYAAGAGVTAGTWNTCTADLSEYSNVFVQVYYDGTSAVRTIDDISLEMASAVAKPTISGDENFVGSTTVTITHADADAIYYTTDGSDPKTSGTKQTYSVPFTVNADGTTTVKAIAVKGSDVSAVAEKTFTKVEALESMAALLEATVSAETAFNVVISNWVVTGVQGTRAWIADAANEKGILLYKSGHNFVAGNKLNGVVIGTKTKLYQGYPELTTLVSTDVTVTTAEAITPRATTIAALTSGYNKEQGTVVKLENVTYSSSVLSDGVNSIAADNKLFSSLALVDGTTYDITGVVEYLDGSVVKIMPRSADDVEAKSAVVTPTAANLAALKAAERGTYILTLTNAVVTYVNGNNAFIEDATGGALIYFASHGYSAGDCLNGDYQVITTDYQGKFEITSMEPQAGAATTTAEIPLTTVSIATLNANFSSYESRRVKIAAANVTDAVSGSDRNGAINDGAALAVYAAAGASTITLTADDNVDIIGYPGFHNTDQQLNVWRQEDITVNVKEDPELAYNPASETIEEGDAWSAPTLVNPHSLTIASYASNNEAVATVSGEGVIALAGGLGTAVITAHTDGDATYAAGNATYTITVNEAGVYSMSFDLTRASYDDAADAEVVWNSSVVTFTADKNDGTKVTNYLAGNYSGTTLITETRFYTKNSLSFVPQEGVTITKVEWMSTAKGYATKLAAETFVNATAVVDGTDDKLVIITPTASGEFSVTLTDAARATGITVYYTAESEKAKLPASISIDDMNMAVGDDDILLSAIAATSNPNKKAISYAVTSGTAVTIEGTGAEAALHAAAEGSATITATIPNDLGNYTGATTSFTVTVSAAATLESIAISGDASVLEYNDGDEFNPAGLVVTGHYSDDSEAEITDGITWAFDPDPLTEGTTSVSVTATVGEISSAAVVVNGLTVSGPAPVGDNYVKVTASQADWSGDYLLVYEDGENAYVWNGDYSDGASNYASATISSNTIAKPAAAAVITIAAASEGKYTLQVNGDKYFQDNGSNSKLIFTDAIADAAEVTISYEADWTKLLFSERCIRFNNASGQTRFRFYAASSQQAVQLYKKETAPEPVLDWVDGRTGLTPSNYYTICLPKKVTHFRGATIWDLKKRNSTETEVYLEEAELPFAAGTPFIIQATADKLEVVYEGDATSTPVESGALRGTLTGLDTDAFAALGGEIYILKENAIRPRTTGNWLSANRAYIVYTDLIEVTEAPQGAPGKRVRAIPMQPKVATGMDALNASDKPVKMIINGQLFILRGEKLYDATGRLVK